MGLGSIEVILMNPSRTPAVMYHLTKAYHFWNHVPRVGNDIFIIVS